jgi:hypothetical protein
MVFDNTLSKCNLFKILGDIIAVFYKLFYNRYNSLPLSYHMHKKLFRYVNANCLTSDDTRVRICLEEMKKTTQNEDNWSQDSLNYRNYKAYFKFFRHPLRIQYMNCKYIRFHKIKV